MTDAALIVTAELRPEEQARFDALRRKHFPKDRNYLDAHLTLFHALPGARVAEVQSQMERITEQPLFEAQVTKVMSLGRGVAFRVASEELQHVRQQLAEPFADGLTAQDRTKNEFHITVQNKVDSDTARALRDELSEDFEPYPITIAGLALWWYRDGPWEAVKTYAFR